MLSNYSSRKTIAKLSEDEQKRIIGGSDDIVIVEDLTI